MEQGSFFFAGFIDLIVMLRWPLGLFFSGCVLWYLKQLHPDERRYATFMFCYLFLIISAYWLVKPIKKALLVGYYQSTGWTVGTWHLDAAQVELVAKVINVVLALGGALCFTGLSSYVKREKLALSMIAIFGTGFSIFALTSLVLTDPLRAWLFYFYGDFFITLMLAAFFAFLNDSGDRHMARRLYGLIILGGVLGGFFGSVVVATYAKQIDLAHSAWICVGLLSIMALMAWLAAKQIKPAFTYRASQTEIPFGSDTDWHKDLNLLLNSPYLLGIAFTVGLYEMVSSVMDYQFTTTVLHFIANTQMKSYFANVFSFTTFVSILVQLFLTRSVMTHMGMGRALLLLPLSALTGETGFVLFPGLLLGSLLNTFDNSLAYSVNQSLKESLYVPMRREDKYRAKAFVDVFVFRCSKAIALLLVVPITMVFRHFESLRWLSLIVFVLLGIWFMVIYRIGSAYKTMTLILPETHIPERRHDR